MTYYAAMAVVSAVITLVLSMVVMKLGYRYRLYPAIRARDVHTRPTPRLGGVAMFAGILVAFAVASQVSWFSLVFDRPGPVFAILGAALMIVVIGVLDDIYDLDWMIKLAGQILAAGLLAWQGVAISSLPIGGLTVGSSQMSIMLTIFAIVLVMNAVNFIDGLDGLVAGVAIIANGAFFLYSFLLSDTATGQTERFNLASLISAILIGACLGFLPFNWHPAKLFMGDAGALLVGLLMATSAIAVTGEIDPNPETFGRSQLLPAFLPILLPFAILIVPLLDFALAVFRRLKAGKSPFSADRKHLHHRLLDMGQSAPARDADLLRLDGRRVRGLPAHVRRAAVRVGRGLHRGRHGRLRGRHPGPAQPPQAPRGRRAARARRRRVRGRRGVRPARRGRGGPAARAPHGVRARGGRARARRARHGSHRDPPHRRPEPGDSQGDDMTDSPSAPAPAETSAKKDVFTRILIGGALLALAIAVVGGIVGFAVDGGRGLLSAVIGSAMALVFLGLTAGSILFANRFQSSPIYPTLFFSVVLGAWLLKFVVFLAVAMVLKEQQWINLVVLFVTVIVGVVGTLVMDMIVITKARVGYVSDAQLPGR